MKFVIFVQMQKYFIFVLLFSVSVFGQDIRSIQLHNPQTNDQTPVIGVNEQLVLRFDDLSNSSTIYRYTFKHYDRNWKEDGLFFTEFASGSMNALIDQFQYSFNTLQKYTHYELVFPNEKIRPKISGNYEIIVYKTSPEKPLFKRRFYIVEDGATVGLQIDRHMDSRRPYVNQRVQVQAASAGADLVTNANSVSLNVMQNNNPHMALWNMRPSTTLGGRLMWQQLDLAFPGNNEFYYFDNKNINQGFDMVAGGEIIGNENHTYLHPVWAYPLNYQFQPDVNGAFYFRRNDLGIERNADTEGDYAWVYFSLDSEPYPHPIYVLGGFNNFQADDKSRMVYDEGKRQYVAKIYLKQGFYNYILATENGNALDFGEINGNFWQTENLYQAFLYYRPFGRNFDALVGYGEFRTPVR